MRKTPDMRRSRLTTSVIAFTSLISLLAIGTVPASAAPDACQAMATTVAHLGKPSTGGNLLTPWPDEAAAAKQYGFAASLESFKAATSAAEGLTAVHRLYRPANWDFTWALAGSTQLEDAVSAGYRDEGVNFYALSAPVLGCTQALRSYVKNGVHRVATRSEQAGLETSGWSALGIAFYAPGPAEPTDPPPTTGDTTFSFAVMPDTQNEVGNYDQRMPKRVSWLINNKQALDLKWVLHSGDLQSWDTSDHYQYKNNFDRLAPLGRAGLPFIGAIGNHDTAAVCPGGSACPGAVTNVTVRDTTTWNSFYTAGYFGLEGVFETGKSDNGWRRFDAGGLSWLILNLELWPRPDVIAWARGVVAEHPRDNVIVLTHSFLEADGRVSTSNGGYGATAPSVLWAALDDYPNVVMIFSGHVGAATETSLTAVDGHRTAAFLQALHAPENPVRIVRIDTVNGTIASDIRVSFNPTLPTGQQDVDVVQTQYTSNVSGMRWVR